MKLQELAFTYLKQFIDKTRSNGDKFVTLIDQRDQALMNLVYKAHADMLPDDFKYQFVVDALTMIAKAQNIEELEYPNFEEDDEFNFQDYGELTRWFGSNSVRAHYANLSMKDGSPDGIWDLLNHAYNLERYEVYYIVLEGLSELYLDLAG